MNDVRGEALCYFVGLHFTPRTFRIIIGTNTNEIKCGYGQLPRKEADTNNRRQEAWPGESLRSLHFWLDETPRVTWVILISQIATAQVGTTSQKGRSMTRWSTWVSAVLTGQNASSHMNYINISGTNCAALWQRILMKSNTVTASYRENKLILTTKGKKHDQVNHWGLGISDSLEWTRIEHVQ